MGLDPGGSIRRCAHPRRTADDHGVEWKPTAPRTRQPQAVCDAIVATVFFFSCEYLFTGGSRGSVSNMLFYVGQFAKSLHRCEVQQY